MCSRGCCQSCSSTYGDNFKNVGLRNVYWFCSSCNQAHYTEIHNRQNKLLKASVKAKKTTEPVISTASNTDKSHEIVDVDTTDNSKAIDSKLDTEKKSQSRKEIICKFFKENRFRYGATGKGCHFKHIKICQRYIKHGHDKKSGCVSCEKFHPKLCKGSINTRKCFIESCRAYHLKGTKRFKDKNDTRHKKHITQNKAKSQNENNIRHDSFLELKKEIANIQHILQGTRNSWGQGFQVPTPALPHLMTQANPGPLLHLHHQPTHAHYQQPSQKMY